MTKEISICNVHQEITEELWKPVKGLRKFEWFPKEKPQTQLEHVNLWQTHNAHFCAHRKSQRFGETFWVIWLLIAHSQTSFESLDFCDLSNLRHLHLQLWMATLYSYDAIQKICCHVVSSTAILSCSLHTHYYRWLERMTKLTSRIKTCSISFHEPWRRRT